MRARVCRQAVLLIGLAVITSGCASRDGSFSMYSNGAGTPCVMQVRYGHEVLEIQLEHVTGFPEVYEYTTSDPRILLSCQGMRLSDELSEESREVADLMIANLDLYPGGLRKDDELTPYASAIAEPGLQGSDLNTGDELFVSGSTGPTLVVGHGMAVFRSFRVMDDQFGIASSVFCPDKALRFYDMTVSMTPLPTANLPGAISDVFFWPGPFQLEGRISGTTCS